MVADVRTLLKNDGLLNSIAPATFAEYNNTQYIKVDSPKGHKVRNDVEFPSYLQPNDAVEVHKIASKLELTLPKL